MSCSKIVDLLAEVGTHRVTLRFLARRTDDSAAACGAPGTYQREDVAIRNLGNRQITVASDGW